MKFIIHYNGRYKDSIIIEASTIDELTVIAFRETNKRGWKPEHIWSEQIN